MAHFSWLKTNGSQQLAGAERRPIVELCEVDKAYKTAAGEFPVLKKVCLQMNAGEFVSIIGKSGSGKTTLLNMISGIDRPSNGEVWVNQTALHQMSENQLARWRGHNLGIVFQFFQLLPMLSIYENILLAMDFAGKIPTSERKQRALHLLSLVGLEDHAYKLPAALSGGQQQRVAIARALANDPPVLIADEPTGNLDSKTAEAVFELFDQLVSQGKTIIIVTHDSSLAKRTQRTALIVDGEIANEYIARALPSLTNEQLMCISRAAAPRTYQPGTFIFHQGSACQDFYVVADGKVEIVLPRVNASDVVVAQLGPGQYFGEMQLLYGNGRSASVRTTEAAPAEVYVINPQTLSALLSESESLRELMLTTANERQAHNRAVLGD